MIDFSEGLFAFILRVENTAHQNVAFNVVGILLQNFFRQPVCFGDQLRVSLGSGNVVVAELYACVEIVGIEFGGLAQLFKRFLKTLEAFVGAGQSPVGRGQLLVDLNGIAKLKRSFLKLFIFQVNFALFDVGDLWLFRDWCSR